MAFEHESGFPDTHDRFPAFPDFAALVFRGRTFSQSAESNELQSIIRARAQRIGDMVARDGDRINGAAVVIDAEAGAITLTEGFIYAAGDARRVPERVIEDVDLTGDVSIGIRIHRTFVTADDMPELRGLIPGSAGEGEDGAARVIEAVSWSLRSLDEPGDYYQVYLVRGGTVLDQTPPANLTTIAQQIAAKDRAVTGGNYVIEGCQVTAIGQVGSAMHFAVSEGAASIYGYTRTRSAALRYGEPLSWDTEEVDAEPHIFSDGGSGTATIALNRGPVDQISSVIVTKQITQTVVRGTPNNTADVLQHSPTEVLSVTQGATTFAVNTSWVLTDGKIDWSPAGAEPAVGSSYQVTYRYLDVVTPDAIDVQSVTVSGGVTATPVIVRYSYKLPRVDRLCLDELGQIVYLRGVSAAVRPKPPIERSNLLGLADIYNDWRGTPVVTNNGTRACHLPELWRYINFFKDVADLVALLRLRADIDSREPVAKHGVFADPCIDDTYRDQGVPQTAAVYGGSIQLAIDPTIHQIPMAAPVMLPYTEEVIIEQPRKTGCVKINPYANFNPLPAQLSITPAADYWTETRTIWLSDKTRQISGTNDRTTVTEEMVDRRQESLAYLRQIEVSYTIKGFGPGEELELLAFDNIDITPEPLLVGDANGEIHGSFVIPADVTAGSKWLFAGGASGAEAWAEFVGAGTIDITTMQRLVSIETVPPPPDPTPTPAPDTPGAAPNLPQNVIRQWRFATGRWNSGPVKSDPQAQSFALPETRHITGVEVQICKVGDAGNPISIGIVPMRDGDPTEETMASAVVPMTAVAVGDRVKATYPAPLARTPDAMLAFVVKSDDNEHSISIADLGAYDADADEWVAQNPYTIGNRHSSSNAVSWDHHQGSDLTFWLYAAHFTSTTRRVLLGTVSLVDCSDLVIKATVHLPTAECSLHFEVVRPGAGGTIVMLPDDPIELTDYITEEVEIWAVLRGTETVSPVLFPGVTVIAGTLRATGDYVSRAFPGKTAAIARYKALLPAGATATFTIDRADGDWEALPLGATEVLNDGWIERRHENSALLADQVRVRIQLTGTPAARPAISDPRFITF